MNIHYFSRLSSYGIATLCFVAVGCGGSDDDNKSGHGTTPSTSGSGGSSQSDVTGTLANIYITATGETRAFTSPNTAISAFVSDGSKGLVTIKGTIDESGNFTIPGVPSGAYTLGIGAKYPSGHLTSFLVTSERHLDLGAELATRPDVVINPTSPTDLVFNVTGLSPWQQDDRLELFASGAGAWGELSRSAENPPAVGATALQGFTIDTSELTVRGLIDGGKGDRAFLTQLTTRSAGALAYQSLAGVFVPAPFTQQDGKPTTLSGAFAAVPQKEATIEWKRSQFHALAHDVHPQAVVNSHSLWVSAEIGGSARSLSSMSPTLVKATTGDDTTDVSLDLRYGDPFPSGWSPTGTVFTTFKVALTMPGASGTKMASASAVVTRPLSTFAAAPAQPVLSPPRELRVNGQSAYENQTGVGETPVVSWSAPTLGSPTSYIVAVRRLNATTDRTSPVAWIRTSATTVTIPPGLLSAGSFYYLQVSAETGYKPLAPYTYAAENASADTLSAVLAP